MQYILTQEEYDALRSKIKDDALMPSKKELQKFCTKIADTVPVKSGWMKGKVWQCIITIGDEYEWYCDDCPAKSVCPYEYKSWSK